MGQCLYLIEGSGIRICILLQNRLHGYDVQIQGSLSKFRLSEK
jgi:hypothetical protein